MRIGCGADHVAQEAVRLAEVDDDGGVGDPDAQREAVAEHGEVGEHLAHFDAALVRRADDPLGPLPGDLGGKRQGVGPEQLGRLGRAGEREIGGRRRAGADGQADPGVRSFGGLVDAAEHRLAAGADQQAGAAVLGRHDGHRHGHLIAEPLTEHHRHRAFGDPLGRQKVGRVGGIGIPAVDDVEGRALVVLAGGRLLRFRLGAGDVTGQAVDEAAEQQTRSRRTTATPVERRRRSPTGRRRRSRRGTRRRDPSRRRGLRR